MKKSVRFAGAAIATLFGAGYFPFAPGTIGSLISVGLFISIPGQGIFPLLILVPVLPVAYFGCSVGQRLWGEDPSYIVVDEFAGCWIACLAAPASWGIAGIAVAFVLFRIFDIAKPWPVSIFDRMKSPVGILLDDVAAGVLAAMLLYTGGLLHGIF